MKTAAKRERRRSPAAPENKNIHKQLRSQNLVGFVESLEGQQTCSTCTPHPNKNGLYIFSFDVVVFCWFFLNKIYFKDMKLANEYCGFCSLSKWVLRGSIRLGFGYFKWVLLGVEDMLESGFGCSNM